MSGFDFNAGMTGMNDPYMRAWAQSVMASQQQGGMPSQTYGAPSQVAFGGVQPLQQDQFQKSGVPGAIGLAAAAGGATGLGMYLANPSPIKELDDGTKTLKDSFIRIAESHETKKAQELLKTVTVDEARMPILKSLKVADIDTYNAIKKYATAENAGTLGNEVTDLLPSGLSKEQAKDIVQKAETEFSKIDMQSIEKEIAEAGKAAKELSYHESTKKLARLKELETKVASLADNAKPELENLIKQNHDLFGIKGTPEEIAKEATRTAEKGKKAFQSYLTEGIKFHEQLVQRQKASHSAIAKLYNAESKTFGKGVTESITTATKEFRWKTAGKWGLIAGGVVLGLAALSKFFGGGNKAQQA